MKNYTKHKNVIIEVGESQLGYQVSILVNLGLEEEIQPGPEAFKLVVDPIKK